MSKNLHKKALEIVVNDNITVDEMEKFMHHVAINHPSIFVKYFEDKIQEENEDIKYFKKAFKGVNINEK